MLLLTGRKTVVTFFCQVRRRFERVSCSFLYFPCDRWLFLMIPRSLGEYSLNITACHEALTAIYFTV
jgi:hypothetical protein